MDLRKCAAEAIGAFWLTFAGYTSTATPFARRLTGTTTYVDGSLSIMA
jgi:hypothetical protein